MKIRLYFLLAFLPVIACTCKSSPETGGVVATTAWTAAYAMAAGVENITVLAPYEMAHPSEYEMRAGDIAKIAGADMIIHAGYEVMLHQIRTGLAIPDEKLLMITTSYRYSEIEQAVMLIAERTGTELIARKNLEEIQQMLEQGKNAIQKNGLDTIPVLVHFFQRSFAEETGIQPSGVFGPAPPEPKQILSLTQTNAALIIDNAHNPVGGALRQTIRNAEYLMLLNFPGLEQTRTISDVIRYNMEQLTGR